MRSVTILGVRVDAVGRNEFRAIVRDFLLGTGQKIIFTPNPEMIVKAQSDRHFRDVLHSGSINLCDGKGVELASGGVLTRLPGIDALEDVCAVAEAEGKSVYLLGSGSDRATSGAVSALRTRYPRLAIAGAHPGPGVREESSPDGVDIYPDQHIQAVVERDILSRAPAILFVAFGHGKQEKWIAAYLHTFPSVKIGMGVGGAFDVFSGMLPRAPRWMRATGFEWLWRLLVQPRRIRRIWNAVVIFSLYLLRDALMRRRR